MRADRREIAAVFAGGMLGAAARALLAEALASDPGAWPWGTFLANLTGTMLLGYAVTRLQERLPLSSYRRPFLGTGICGALTTFSTVQVELLGMVDAGAEQLALAYAAASMIAGFAAMTLTSNLVRRARALV